MDMDASALRDADSRRARQILTFYFQNTSRCANSTIQEAIELARVINGCFDLDDTYNRQPVEYPTEWDTNRTVLIEDLFTFRRHAFKRLIEKEINTALDTAIESKGKEEEKKAQIEEKLKDLERSRKAYGDSYKAKVLRGQSSDNVGQPITDKEKCRDVDEFHKRLVDWKTEEGRLRDCHFLLEEEIAVLDIDITTKTYILGVMGNN
ncbi:uncharacterized protein FMAN_15246 [Fusarium mangiferae]|uniref:Uncharacterized protein n=1 Tax=Fusarium mangiferae TaxID=192010 RepID=A0A1L7UD47_FUSMA|nr:uncharacterized protein FMAN_15246 [Fusarium mangiferae]CVL07072.1 uncharacterized protein FMAN_15246 [Fusarium mangiferae]